MEKNRTVLAVILSLLVILTFQYYVAKRYPDIKRSAVVLKSERKEKTVTPSSMLDQKISDEKENEYKIETDKFTVIFSDIGGAIRQVFLKEFSDKDKPYELISIKNRDKYLAAIIIPEYGIDQNIHYAGAIDGNKITFSYTSEYLDIQKIFVLDNAKDYISFALNITNKTGADIIVTPIIISCSGINIANPLSQRYNYASMKADGIFYLEKKDFTKEGFIAWNALNNDYFMMIFKPENMARKSHITRNNNEGLSSFIQTDQLNIMNGMKITNNFIFYFGPFDVNRVKALKMGLEEAVNYGKLNAIVRVLLETLGLFHKIVKNWGVAIIVLTVLINIAVFPFTKSSYRSMRISQELQPEIEKLKAVHKDNPTKMNKEMMELYRKYKINPLSGCLPMLLQFPIFFALYHALMRSVELKGSNFLWIKDLSRPDSLPLPISIPVIGRSLNILPIATAIIMFLQQKIMSAKKTEAVSEQMRQQQMMMMVMMPVMMLIFFYSMPSGFVLYFLINSAIMAWIQHRIKASMA